MAEFAFAQIGQWLFSETPVLGKVLGFQIDSRAVRPGDLFFALKGERVDGHAFYQMSKQKARSELSFPNPIREVGMD